MHKSSIAFAATLLCGTAFASDAVVPSAEHVLNSIVFTRQSDTARFQVGPRWSEQYGWAIDARGGMMLSEALAVGLVVTLGENDRELVFNTGLQLDDKTIIIGTLAGHQQNVPLGDDREWVDQLEGGLSLRSDDGVGFIGGYEINAYGTSSSTDGSLDTGTMLGAEANLLLHPIEGMTAKLGAGYESINWSNGDPTEGWTANLNVTQRVGDALTLKLGIDLGQSEDRYTAGTEFLLADGGNTNSRLGLEYSYIVDKDGGDDDQRLTAYWRMGFGESRNPAASSAMGYAGAASLQAAAGYDHNRILSAVMEKPDYLPSNVLAKDDCIDRTSEILVLYEIGENGPGGFEGETTGFIVDDPLFNPNDPFTVKSLTINGVDAPARDFEGFNESAPIKVPAPDSAYIFEWQSLSVAEPGQLVRMEYIIDGICYYAAAVAEDVPISG